MKKIVLTVAAIVAAASMAQALSIVNSKHDIPGGTAGAYGTNAVEGQICIYCHTPHNPIRDVPLWNRNNPTSAGWSFYNSPTLTQAARGAQFNADSISLFCLSCHDGTTAIGAYINEPLSTNDMGADNISFTRGTNTIASKAYANIGNSGKDLTNDHPVGFDYSVAQSSDTASGTGGLRAIGEVKNRFGITDANYNPFYYAGNLVNQMECASCHKVHDPGTSNNFLRIENNKSALCLACHNK